MGCNHEDFTRHTASLLAQKSEETAQAQVVPIGPADEVLVPVHRRQVQPPLLERKTDMTHARETNGSRVLAGTLNPQLVPLVTVCADAQLVNAAQLLSIGELPLQAKYDALQLVDPVVPAWVCNQAIEIRAMPISSMTLQDRIRPVCV